jgi:tRNA(fMet)-specific endonuclease VapC
MATIPIATLLDTDVLIDILRAHPPAQVWLQAYADLPVVIHGVTAMEILMGSRNKNEWQRHQTFLNQFVLVWPTATEFEEAYLWLAQHRLTTALGIPDALIAATVLKRGWQLYSFNLKHYRQIEGLNVQTPYQR